MQTGSSSIDWKNLRRWEHLYFFKRFNEELKFYTPCFIVKDFDDNDLDKILEDPKCRKLNLFQKAEHSSYPFHVYYSNYQLDLFLTYFKEIFEERAFIEGHMPTHRLFELVLPESTYLEIINFINNYNLLTVRDLIFELIALAQDYYIKSSWYYELPEIKKLSTTAKSEIKKVEKIFDKTSTKFELSDVTDLLGVSFIFRDETIKIEHKDLLNDIVSQFKAYFDNLAYKNWRMEIERFPSIFRDHDRKREFKNRLAKAYYNFLTYTDLFELPKGKSTPNELMKCILTLLEFSLIPIGQSDEIESVKIKHIRNWVNRNDIEEEIAYLDIDFDVEKLSKYFDSQFLKLTKNIKRADSLNIGSYLSKRFNLPNLVSEFAHLASCIRECSTLIGHQESLNFIKDDPFFMLLSVISDNKKLSSLKFTIEGSEEEYEVRDRLPLFLIEQSIRLHKSNSNEEFNTDLVKSSFLVDKEDRVYLKYEKKFNQPHERFAVRFTKSCYDFLLNEAPPEEGDYFPSKRYYLIIANLLKEAWFFYRKFDDEAVLVKKVESWHNLSEL